jgi:hypothetical protein
LAKAKQVYTAVGFLGCKAGSKAAAKEKESTVNEDRGILQPMNASPLYLGTSSWVVVGWETAFYPPGTKEADYLPFYATKFNSVEIDSTFYRIPVDFVLIPRSKSFSFSRRWRCHLPHPISPRKTFSKSVQF